LAFLFLFLFSKYSFCFLFFICQQVFVWLYKLFCTIMSFVWLFMCLILSTTTALLGHVSCTSAVLSSNCLFAFYFYFTLHILSQSLKTLCTLIQHCNDLAAWRYNLYVSVMHMQKSNVKIIYNDVYTK
jgi:hypothetical protein